MRFLWGDGVPFDDLCAVFPRMLDRSLEELGRDTFLAKRLGDEEADNGPDRLVVHLFQYSGALEGGEVFSRAYRAPGDRFSTGVGDDSRNLSRFNDFFHSPFVFLALLLVEFRSRQPPPHAPASAACAPLAEQLFQIRPALGRNRTKFEAGNFQRCPFQIRPSFAIETVTK